VQLTSIVPSPGIPVTVYWLELAPVNDQVRLAAVMANGVAADAETPQDKQLTARNDPKKTIKQRLCIAASFAPIMLHLVVYL
jgi:hypothetical protein